MATVTASVRLFNTDGSVQEITEIQDALLNLLQGMERDGNIRIETVASTMDGVRVTERRDTMVHASQGGAQTAEPASEGEFA